MYPQGKYPCPKDATGATLTSAACTLTLPVPAGFERNYHYNDTAFYAQDSWKALPRLTLNLGLRWEYYGVQHNANPALDSNFVMGQVATIFDQIRNGSVQLAKDGGVFWKPAYNDWGPRSASPMTFLATARWRFAVDSELATSATSATLRTTLFRTRQTTA